MSQYNRFNKCENILNYILSTWFTDLITKFRDNLVLQKCCYFDFKSYFYMCLTDWAGKDPTGKDLTGNIMDNIEILLSE